MSLYGAPRPLKPAPAPDTVFSSALSSLITTSSATNASNTMRSRARPPRKDKDSIFTTHNRNLKKRAAADMLSTTANGQQHTTSSATVDPDDWSTSRRRMEKKARLYKALKRGDIDDETGEKYAVDFDRKWAESEQVDDQSSDSDSSFEHGDGETPGGEQQVEYTDEFGRTRTGTASEAAKAQRALAAASRGQQAQEDDRYTARPVAPSVVHHGDAIQTRAFDPDSAAMAALAGKRDRSATPPEATRYDARAEIRKRGTGFFAFSKDEEERQRQMEGLEAERRATEKARARAGKEEGETEGRQVSEDGAKAEMKETARERRKRELEERRKLINEKRGEFEANRFLDGLGSEILEKQQLQQEQQQEQTSAE